MKKLICLLAAFIILFTACGENNKDNTPADDAPNGVVTDGDGVIDENNDGNDNIIDDATDGAADIVDGAADATKEVADGARNAARDMTGADKNKNSTK